MVKFILNQRKVLGSLLGLAIGDALGAPLEGGPAPDIPLRHYTSGGRFGIPPGHFTDDTLQAIAVARSLIVCRGFSPEDMIRRLLDAFLSAEHLFGPTSSTVFRLILGGRSIREAVMEAHQRNGGSRTNGSVMRGFPVGIYYRNPLEVYRISMECSSLTHLDPIAGESSAFANLMVSRLCRGDQRSSAYKRAISCCRSMEVKGVLENFRLFRPEPSLDALGALHCALVHLMDAESFEDALYRAVNMGGDADTIGAICGALAGACWGIDGIPAHLLDGLHRRHEIMLLAEDLWSVSKF